METYIFKFSACLAVFWLVYVLFLERQNMHQLKRFYLLGALVLALVIPLLTITYYVEPVVTDFDLSQTFIPIEPIYGIIEEEIIPFWNLEKILWLVYGIGVLLFLGRFVINLFRMYKRISGHEKISERSYIYVLLQELRIPHSFFKYIFLNQTRYQKNVIPKEVILHEETHAKQLHSLDVIIIELLQIAFWFHPLVYILKHHIKLNHEFLADQAVLQDGVDTKTYQNILLQFSSSTDEYQLTSAINYSSIKKRFTVMKTNTSKTRIWLSSLLLLPIITILYYSFSNTEYVEKDNTDIVDAIIEDLQEADTYQMQYTNGASEKLMQEYLDFIKEYTNTNTIYVEKYERAIIIYEQIMSNSQRESVEKYPKRLIPEPNLSKTKPRKPSATQFEAFKNATKYAIWVDGKHVSNSVLSNYSVNDFVHFSGSIVHKNARSAKFPQPNQYHLYTKAGFKSTYQDSQLNRYKKATVKYSNAISDYLKGTQIENSELKILKAQVDKIYTTFTKEELKKHNILPVPPVPSEKSENTEGVKKYIKKYKKYEALRSSKPHYINKSEKEQQQMDALFSDLGGMYFRLSRANKAKVKRPIAPVRPYVKITLNGKTYYKKFEDLTKEEKATLPPPPPPPTKKSQGGPEAQDYYNPSFLEYIIEMEQQGASFYLDDEKISAKKAKSIATNNKGKSTEMLTQKDVNGNYVVKLSSATKNNRYARSIDLKVLNDDSYLIDGIKATKRTFSSVFNQLHQDITPEVRNNIMNIYVSSAKEISNKETWFIFNQLQDYGFYRIVTPNQDINRAKGNTPFAIESEFSTQQKPTKKQVASYNSWAKAQNSKAIGSRIVKLRDYNRFKAIYDSMSKEQKKNAQPFPEFPPPPARPEVIEEERILPPPPPIAKNASPEEVKRMKKVIEDYKKKHPESVTRATQDGEIIEIVEIPVDQEGKTRIGGKEYFYKIKDGVTTYYDRHGNKVDINKIPPPPPPTKAAQYKNGKKKTLNEIIKETPKGVKSGYELLENGESHYFTVYKGKKTYYNRDGYITNKKGDILPPPPPAPPAPESTLDFVIRMAKTNAKFFYKLKPISSDKAIAILKKNPKLNINAQKTDTKEPLIYISNKPIHIGTKSKNSKKEKGGPNADGYESYSISEVKAEYIKKYKRYESLRYAKPHFIKKSKKNKKLMSDLWVELRQMYFYTLTKKEKENLKLPITPFAPYVKINKDGKSYYKVNNKLTDEERKVSAMFSTKKTSNFKGLDLIDDSDPIVIPIGTYVLEKDPIKVNKTTKRTVLISISEDGIYSISKDDSLKNFESVSLQTIETLIAKLSEEEIENTFIFSKAKDSKKFRSKPSKSSEYQDDIEVILVKDDIRFTTMEIKGKYREYPSYQLVLDNDTSKNLKSHVSKLAELFKKYGITNLTL
ncbi:hypothetical protein FBALC1_02252 [Flavobacteriales bacterium ALC-1]|nr:hypothetical protein FBALC1_02252 [Flavobacteriales bacterium ALC-1]